MGPKNQFFFTDQARGPVFFDISRYLKDQFFDIVWGCHSPRNPQKIVFLDGLS